jgi:GNAT superfamily N-acetyltransferase
MIHYIKPPGRQNYKPLLESCTYDRVIIDSILEGNYGHMYINSGNSVDLIRLDSGSFTVIFGNPHSLDLEEMLSISPVAYVTPQDQSWKDRLSGYFHGHYRIIHFTDYISTDIKKSELVNIIKRLDPQLHLEKITKHNAEKVVEDIGNEYFFENFHSIEDYVNRGIGYLIRNEKKILSAATSMAQCSTAIDIEIETLPGHRRKGYGTIVGAKLVLHCLENSIDPRWLAANTESEHLAERLGYIRGEAYDTFEIHHAVMTT